ncbi:unnamed protein product [Didymodactylos carnosus]|uniref:Uncharacterized protein n=1 Tax=Didymodactylos carnosus TaxID=1234261 RepID=A0A814NGP7_9BILA|nr:unnamed protein product [Didymodactylos carnosus]CAF3858769.1 unnamed protein product [Didymodactylos carnosus]
MILLGFRIPTNQMPNSNDTSNRKKDSSNNQVYDIPTTVELLKALFERENYSFSSFSSADHNEIVKKTIENFEKQNQIKPSELIGNSVLNRFVNDLCAFFSNSPYSNSVSTINDCGTINYEIYSARSLNALSLSSSAAASFNNEFKSIWFSKSMIVGDARRILSTVLYGTTNNTLPAEFAEHMLVYENIMIPLENDSKLLFEEILKISF